MINLMAISWLVCGVISATVFLGACYKSHHGVELVDVYNAVLITVLGYFSVVVCGFCLVFLLLDREC